MLSLIPALFLATAVSGPAHAGGEPLKLTPVGVKDVQIGLAGGSLDLVIEADGSEASIHRAAEWCRPGGTLLLVAGYYAPKTWNFTTAFVKELTVIFGAFYGHGSAGRDVDAAATVLGRTPEIAKVLNTHRFPLDAAADAIAFAGSDSESLKVVVEP